MNADTAYCRQQTETYDRDRYILTMAAPDAARAALWALYAFNHELAKTREITRDIHAGHIRFAWWREALAKFYNGAPMPAHDVARALGDAIRIFSLPLDDFTALLDARAGDLDSAAPASLDALAAYAQATNSPLVNLSARILGVTPPEGLASAYGLTGIIRALPFYARQNRCVLPLPMMHDIGLMPEQFHHLSDTPGLRAAVAQIAQRARTDLSRCVPAHSMFARQARMVDLYLRRVDKAQNNPFDPRVCGQVPFLALRIIF